MWDYIFGTLAGVYVFNKFKLFLFRRKWYKPAPIMKGAEPIYINKGKTGILFIHGFTASPQEFGEVAHNIAKQNMTVSVPLLKGHGTCPEDLNRTDWKDWEESAARAYLNLRKKCDKVFVAGNSGGGNIAIMLASKFKVDGLILMSTIIKFRIEPLFKAIIFFAQAVKNFKTKPEYAKKYQAQLKNRVHYRVIPLLAFVRFLKLVAKSRRKLKKIRAPTLIMQSEIDHLTPKKNAIEIYEKIKTKDKHIIFFKKGIHVLLVGERQKIIYKEILKFIKERTTSSTPA